MSDSRIFYPWTDLDSGKYKYSHPLISQSIEVVVSESDGGKIVEFKNGVHPVQLKNMAKDGQFVRVDDENIFR